MGTGKVINKYKYSYLQQKQNGDGDSIFEKFKYTY